MVTRHRSLLSSETDQLSSEGGFPTDCGASPMDPDTPGVIYRGRKGTVLHRRLASKSIREDGGGHNTESHPSITVLLRVLHVQPSCQGGSHETRRLPLTGRRRDTESLGRSPSLLEAAVGRLGDPWLPHRNNHTARSGGAGEGVTEGTWWSRAMVRSRGLGAPSGCCAGLQTIPQALRSWCCPGGVGVHRGLPHP